MKRKALILSVGYGEGHHAAAYAMQEELERRDWQCRVEDVCKMASPVLFSWTQQFYQFCVRRMPWLWGVAYAQTGTTDWSKLLHYPGISRAFACLRHLLKTEQPDVVICTYPLFGYMLDAYNAVSDRVQHYVLIVTDSIEISRPWLYTKAPLVCVPDEQSRLLVCERYGLSDDRVIAAGFPVKHAFAVARDITQPCMDDFRIVYGGYAETGRVCGDIRAILQHVPGASITLLAGSRKKYLEKMLGPELESSRLCILDRTEEMHRLFAQSHLYIGKAGAATMFEAYAAGIPVVVNYALPGQEQGNRQLLLDDGAGVAVESTTELMAALLGLIDDEAAAWHRMRSAMRQKNRVGGAARIADNIEMCFYHDTADR